MPDPSKEGRCEKSGMGSFIRGEGKVIEMKFLGVYAFYLWVLCGLCG